MSVVAPQGFRAAGVACGIKEGGAKDLALVAAEAAVPAAATFTTNRAAAAPVVVSRAHLLATGGRAAAVLINSGCANAATGASGQRAAEASCVAVAEALGVAPEAVLVCSTGLIGRQLPVERVEAAVPGLVDRLGATPADGRAAAEAIMTTDTHPKQTLVEHSRFRVGGMAKGAGMIAPRMATMLAVLTTDAVAEPDALAGALREAVARTFNELIVDGCTSTNDTVVALASGQAGRAAFGELAEALEAACADLASQLAEDAEGTTRVATVRVVGALSDAEARQAARAVASSLLVKTSLYGADPYWGRIVSELGASGATFHLDHVSVAYGGTVVCRGGIGVAHDAEAVAAHLRGERVEITCDLALGSGAAAVLTTDLGHGYIDENMRTS
ncbi:MAG TPA: bifunctional glutamate N-acetyltransferase/amino-acid acetyltransferase ArgJ [Acidimicrobiales bacterium]|nr:bifunctional glutamate N-acetyltransferase/amino-acid acetyltransferase ArgJ [Acidimicrobiales bacterium]